MIVNGVEIPQCILRLQQLTPNEMSTASKDMKRSLRSEVQIKEESDEEDNESYELKKVGQKKIVKILDVNPKEDSENEDPDTEEEDNESEDLDYEEEENENEDPDYEEEIKKKKSIKEESLSETTDPKIKRNLSAYEQMIQKNREEARAFLQSLKIQEAKVELSKAVDSIKKRPKPIKRKYKEEVSPPVLRKSRRIAKLQVDLSEDALYLKAVEEAKVKRVAVKKRTSEILNIRRFLWPDSNNKKLKTIPSEMSFKDAFSDKYLYETYVADVPIQESKSEAKFITYDKSDLKKMTLSDSSIAKITPGRITALSWFPSPEQLIIAAGDKYGNLGVLNVNGESDPYVMNIHLEGITNLQFSPFNQVQLISSSYDGILRCADMVQHKFNEIYNVSDTTCCTYFDILSASTFLVAQKNGHVALVDRRTRGKSFEKKHQCHDYTIKTVNIHPVKRSFFITAENKGSIRLWDLRKLQKNPVADVTYHKRSVSSAYFSPITGNSILATSLDDTVSIFDSSSLTSQVKMKQCIRHNNQTGRWLSVFRAMWLPNSEEVFVIGSMGYPRKIEVFDKNMFSYSIMSHEDLTITSTNVFHPTSLAFAGGNSSGKVFVFK